MGVLKKIGEVVGMTLATIGIVIGAIAGFVLLVAANAAVWAIPFVLIAIAVKFLFFN